MTRFSWRILQLILIALALLLTLSPAMAQDDDTIGAPGIGDGYFPTQGNGGYDVQSYNIAVVVDMDAQQISAETIINAISTQDLARFNLDFSAYEIESVTVQGVDADFDLFAGELVITPAETIAEGESFSIIVIYNGTPPGPGWNFYRHGVIVAGEPVSASGWFPVNEHPLDKAIYSYQITVPEPLIAASNGTLQDTLDNGDGTTTYIWKSQDPIASYLTTVAIAEFDIQTGESASGVPVRNYIYDAARQEIYDIFAQTGEMIDVLETAFGPYPFEAYGVAVHNLRIGFALETQTLSTFGNAFVNESVAVHELAHQWFGNSVSLERWQDIWLNEAFATYAQALWFEYKSGEAGLQANVEGFYTNMASFTQGSDASKQDVINFLDNIGSPDIIITQAEAVAALQILFEEQFSPEELTAAIVEIAGDADEFTADQLAVIVDQLLFVRVQISQSKAAALLAALGRDDLLEGYEIPVVGDPTPDALFSGIVYQRGALTLHVLRLRMGDDAFFELLHTYTEAYRYGNAGTDDFIGLAESIAGEDLSDLFDAWLFSVDLPDIPENGLFYADFAGN